MFWQLRTRTLSLDKPVFMGVVNITPDSFSDGGQFYTQRAEHRISDTVQHIKKLRDAGAVIVDIGGESTRPGSTAVSAEEELRRVLPVMKKCQNTILSVDTMKAEVAEETLAAGAEIINDVSGLADPKMLDVLKRSGAGYILMHTAGVIGRGDSTGAYDNVVENVFEWLKAKRLMMISAGIAPDKIAIDPGLGFGKTTEQNWQLVEHIGRFLELDAPLLVGHSRKKFIREVACSGLTIDEKTRKVTEFLLAKGVHIVRVHSLTPRDENTLQFSCRDIKHVNTLFAIG